VAVGVAIGAAFELDLEERVLAFRNMAQGALQACMSAPQRICARGMLLRSECRRLPSARAVTGRTLTMIWPFRKLPVVRIGFVTVHALGENQRLLEVAIDMALRAVHAEVLSFERILRLGVVKTLVHCSNRNLLPSRHAMAGLATLREGPMMRILVAIDALAEWDARVAGSIVRSRCVAFCAPDMRMQPG